MCAKLCVFLFSLFGAVWLLHVCCMLVADFVFTDCCYCCRPNLFFFFAHFCHVTLLCMNPYLYQNCKKDVDFLRHWLVCRNWAGCSENLNFKNVILIVYHELTRLGFGVLNVKFDVLEKWRVK